MKRSREVSARKAHKCGKRTTPTVLITSGVAFAALLMAVLEWPYSRPALISNAVADIQSSPANTRFAKLVGRWARPDGGYVLEIRDIEASGKMSVAYFNPQPIHVGKAAAFCERDTIEAYIELQDLNYPGSNYALVYEPATDQLKGVYYQAVAHEQYEILFVRLK